MLKIPNKLVSIDFLPNWNGRLGLMQRKITAAIKTRMHYGTAAVDKCNFCILLAR